MTGTHSAAGSASGYQYQADYCLYALLIDGGPGRAISLELHDDVAFDQDGTPEEKLQLKHTFNGAGGLGDMSPQMWKTLKAWMDDGPPADTAGPALTLVSCGSAAESSAAHFLKPDSRSPSKAADLLRKAADESATTTPAMLAAFAKFKNLSGPAQNAFISRITVVDGVPTLPHIDATVRARIQTLPLETAKQDDFMESLWGWWRRRVVEMLSFRYVADTSGMSQSVSSAELSQKLIQLTVAYSEQGLPEYEDLDIDHGDEALEGLDDEIFVRQLGFVKVHNRVIRRAIIDYYRATHSEVRWLQRDFLRTDEVQRYERKLIAAWDTAFGLMLSDLPQSVTPEQEEAAGRQLIGQILQSTPVRIKDHVDQDFYFTGKHHMLAQRGVIGWHRDFESKLNALLMPAEASV